MKDKERLEEIKDLLRLTKKENFVEDYYVLIKLFEYGHADWLIQQVERVEDNDQAIVDLNKHVEELEDENVDLEKQNKCYRATINAMGQILKDAIQSLDVGDKVQGLEYGVAMRDEALEVRKYEGYKGI